MTYLLICSSQPEELRDVRLYAQQYFLEEYPDRHNDSIVDFIEVCGCFLF